jgi:cellobiose-specific phosphotransferase system component IIC
MARWIRIIIGPLPATVLLLPLLFAGSLGVAFALVNSLFQPDHSAAERWANLRAATMLLAWVTAAGLGVRALWVAVLASPATLKRSRNRWWLVAGLFVGLLAAVRWLWVMGSRNHNYDLLTWGVWFVVLGGLLILGSHYLVQLLRPLIPH